MTYYKFVKWEAAPIETVLTGKIPETITAEFETAIARAKAQCKEVI